MVWTRPSTQFAGKQLKGRAKSSDPRMMQFESLLGTIQLMKKSRECNVSNTINSQNLPKSDANSINSGLISASSTAESLQWTEPVRCSQLNNADKITSSTKTVVKFDKKVNGKSRTTAHTSKSDLNDVEHTAANSKATRRKPYIEHREKRTTHLSNTNLTNFREHLSKNELLILSELAHAASLPDEVRTSLLLFLDQHRLSMDNMTIGENGNEQVKKSLKSVHKFDWNLDELRDPNKLKEVLIHAAKVLQFDKKKLVELALERECMMKEEAYHASMASFVELCVRTGMHKLAQSTLTSCYFRGRHKPRSHQRGVRPVRDMEIYNRLMHAWAKEGNTEAVRKLFLIITDLGLKPTFRSYAILLQCLGRQEVISEDAVVSVMQDIAKANFSLESIFNDCQFVCEDQNDIIKAIQSVSPTFSPAPKPDISGYTCSLLTSLNTVPDSLSNPFFGVLDAKTLDDRISRQLKTETADYVIIQSVMPETKLTPAVVAARERLDAEKMKWREALKRSFLAGRQLLRAQVDDHRRTLILPYLRLWKADTYVDMMMQEIDILGQDMAIYSPEIYVLHNMLGHKIFHKYLVQVKSQQYIDKITGLYRKYAANFCSDKLPTNHREMWTNLMTEMKLENFMQAENYQWTPSVTKAVGKFLYDIILSEVKVNVSSGRKVVKKNVPIATKKAVESEIPAFYTVVRVRDYNRTEEVMPHPFLARLYGEAQLTKLMFEPKDMPSLVPPVPWFSHNCGGNLLNTTDFIRSPKETVRQCKMVAGQLPQNLYPMFDGLNSVSACPWAINKPILDLIIKLFVSGGDSKLDIPVRMDQSADLPFFTTDMTADERVKVLKEKNMIVKERKEGYSQWCTVLYRLSIANKYRDEVFWFPHNMDFRGRIYPTPAVFNHFGDDVARSILVFGRGKQLGPNGLDWLKIHLVNLTGFKKRCSNEERLDFANLMMPEVMDSADKPFDGRKWWQTADKPWQTLASCLELAKAVRSSDPEKFVSHIPIHQDGSCNVLQHYAALGRDVTGAQSVNLDPYDVPKDVYSDVLELVEKKRQEDADKGIAIAKSLERYLQRRVIKQTIMTSVYGVTKYGARSQIDSQLRHHVDDFPAELIFDGRAYLAEKTFESLHVMFTTNKAIQDWLVMCAEIISRIRQQPVEWVTPLGWPVQQPYFKTVAVKDKKLGSLNYEKSNTGKQKNALPPNFIHSLDAAHLMLTAIHCLREGVMFASVHDCFWTHACDVPAMNKVCREQFVAMHSEPVLENVAQSFLNKFGYKDTVDCPDEVEDKRRAKEFVNTMLVKTPKQGTFDIKKVLESTYFFS